MVSLEIYVLYDICTLFMYSFCLCIKIIDFTCQDMRVFLSLFAMVGVQAMYESAVSKVVKLTDSNFQKTVIQSDELWMVEFYSNGCGHCKNLEPHWDKAARILKGVVKLGAIDVDANP